MYTAEQTVPSKTLVALKGGSATAGLKSAAFHTGVLAGDRAVFTSARRQYGAAVVSDLDGFCGTAKTLALPPKVKGDRIVNTSSSGGAGTPPDNGFECQKGGSP